MVKIYFVRHCQSMGNKTRTFLGSIDCDITEDGVKQLEYLHGRFKDIKVDKVYSSPLLRAKKTALAAVYGKGLTLITDDDFAEMHVGNDEGKPFFEVFKKGSVAEDVWLNRFHEYAPEGGETVRGVYERVARGLNNLAGNPENEGKTLLVASHGIATRCLVCYLLHNDISKIGQVDWANNTAVSLIVYESGKFRVEYLNDDSHIPEDFMSAAARSVTKMWTEE